MFRIVGPEGEPGGGLVIVIVFAVLATVGFFGVVSQVFSSGFIV